MPRSLKTKKGLDICIEGSAEKTLSDLVDTSLYGVKPVDFPGLVPKLDVRIGDRVKGGSPLFHDKKNPDIKFTSPVSGQVISVVRGDRRRILEVVIKKDGEDYIDFTKRDPEGLSREIIKESLLVSGLWPCIRQRPYHIISDPAVVPKAIFISGFDTAPLAPDFNFIMNNSSPQLFYSGIKVLQKLTDGNVNLILDGATEPSPLLTGTTGVEISYMSGPHPAGNVGIQIHHLDPVNKGETVWYVNLQDIIAIGRLFEEGRYYHERIIALAGSEVLQTGYYRVCSGISISGIVKDNVKEGNLRYISGNVLTGTRIEHDGYLGYYDSLVSVIPEGDYYEFFGWMMPGFNKFSFSRTYASKIIPRKSYVCDTNFHGGERAFVMTGQYEKVLPMDIYPMQLLKAILAGDIDLMENLGIYEVAEEDFALCEFICPSKIEIQSIVRQGIDLMIREMN